jgi:type IV secretory pathway VirB6-like protein
MALDYGNVSGDKIKALLLYVNTFHSLFLWENLNDRVQKDIYTFLWRIFLTVV